MTDRPILFSGPMVRAILEGRKTQTRRLIPQTHPNFPTLCHIRTDVLATGEPWDWDGKHDRAGISLPSFYAPGDRIWVREQWKTDRAYDDLSPSEMGGEEPLVFLADNAVERWGWEPDPVSIWGRHRQGMHMPRWASRITLDVTDVRVQRLQDISEADAKAEGLKHCHDGTSGCPIHAFRTLWDSLNALRAPWNSNPWVIAITFKPHLCNIDQMEPAQ